MTTKPSANIKEELEGDEEHGYVKTFTATVSDSVEFYSIPLPSFLPGYSFTAHHKSLAVSLTTRKPEEEMSCWRLLCCCYRKGRICNLPDDPSFNKDFGVADAELDNSRLLQLPYFAPPWGKQAYLDVTIPNKDDEAGTEITNNQIADFMSKFQSEAVKQGAPLNKAMTAPTGNAVIRE
ncbi:hypothetical protein TL16_g04619 [Triparma laevis f. inornata]|uniref:Uncharacterized protein n=1 Tax=Triparma laevis f. inornata TaxID=1714386 RepID=A0A9W7ABD1_9STRA|nr:hypothetical protein TL16_g04619 [Triparma laevis f. inornata]